MHSRKQSNPKILRAELLERRELLTIIHGTVRDDVQGDQRPDLLEPGVPGIVVFLDLDNDGQLSPTEPQVMSADDDVATPENEAGQYSFDVPAGTYTVRQLLDSNAGQANEFPRYIQTHPLRDTDLANPLTSPYGQLNDQFNPLGYTLEWSGVAQFVNQDLVPNEWQVEPEARVSGAISYAYAPGRQPNEFSEFQQTFDYSVIDHYSLRIASSESDVGVGELALVDSRQTLVSVHPEFQRVQFSVPLQIAPGLRLEVDGALLPNVDPFFLPRASEIVEFQQFRIVQGDGPVRNVVMQGVVDSHNFSSKRAARFGHVVRLPENEAQPFDFWVTRDDDEDGLPTAWEEQGGGVDINGDGVIDLDLFSRGADPFHKDVFVEVDAMEDRSPHEANVDLSDTPGVTATNTILDHVVRAFADAPVDNPDGLGGIRLHIDLDDTDIPRIPFIDPESPWSEFDQIKADFFGGSDARGVSANRNNIVEARRYVYRYGVFADTQASGSTGLAELPGNDFFVSLGDLPIRLDDGALVGGGTPDQQAGTFMHELGHTFGLRHGGDENLNYKPNYLSVMNYHWQVPNSNVGWTLDYSPQTLPTLNQNHLAEPVGIGASSSDARREVFVGPVPYRRVPVDSAIDWNRDDDDVDPDVAVPIYRTAYRDADGTSRTYDISTSDDARFDTGIRSHDDWALRAEDMMFSDDPEFAEGVHACDNPEAPESACYEDLTDFFSLSISPDPFEPETQDEPVEISIFDLSDWFAIDLDDGTWSGGFSLHNEFDQDTFLWSGASQGLFRVNATYVPGGMFTPELYLLDENDNRVGTEVSGDGRVGVLLDLSSVQSSQGLKLIIKNSGVELDPNVPPPLSVDPAAGYRYFLEVYGPRL
ncbi:MAG: hypothetical protein KDB27_31510, partial [Planctomycetales bacterium]|nr:hypothetical protein [Planctomycetales bacterium]